MASAVYFAFMRPEPNGVYSVTFPDVPGAITEGDDLASAMSNAKDALESYLESLAEDGEQLPISRRAEQVAREADGAIICAIQAEIDAKAVRVNITVNERLLGRIDRAAEGGGYTRSGLLALAAQEWLSRSSKSGGTGEVNSRAFVELLKVSLAAGRPATSTAIAPLLADDDVGALQNLCRGAFKFSSSQSHTIARYYHGAAFEVFGPLKTGSVEVIDGRQFSVRLDEDDLGTWGEGALAPVSSWC